MFQEETVASNFSTLESIALILGAILYLYWYVWMTKRREEELTSQQETPEMQSLNRKEPAASSLLLYGRFIGNKRFPPIG